MNKELGGTKHYKLARLALADSTEHWNARLNIALSQLLPLRDFDFPESLKLRHANLLESVTRIKGTDGFNPTSMTIGEMNETEGRVLSAKYCLFVLDSNRASNRKSQVTISTSPAPHRTAAAHHPVGKAQPDRPTLGIWLAEPFEWSYEPLAKDKVERIALGQPPVLHDSETCRRPYVIDARGVGSGWLRFDRGRIRPKFFGLCEESLGKSMA